MTIKEIINLNPEYEIIELYVYNDDIPNRRKTLNCVSFIQDNQSYYLDERLLNQLFMLVSSNENDTVYDVKTKSFLKRDYNLLNNISTSEDCQISFNKRSFMPK